MGPIPITKTTRLQRIVRPVLLVELSAAIREARETGSQTRRPILFEDGDRAQCSGALQARRTSSS